MELGNGKDHHNTAEVKLPSLSLLSSSSSLLLLLSLSCSAQLCTKIKIKIKILQQESNFIAFSRVNNSSSSCCCCNIVSDSDTEYILPTTARRGEVADISFCSCCCCCYCRRNWIRINHHYWVLKDVKCIIVGTATVVISIVLRARPCTVEWF